MKATASGLLFTLILAAGLLLGCDDTPRRGGGGSRTSSESDTPRAAAMNELSRDEIGAIVDDLDEEDAVETSNVDLMDEHELEAACMGGRQEACDRLGH